MAKTCNYPNLERLIEILEILRSENGCAWDREQTHYSLKKNMIEEAYEAVDAIEDGDCKHLQEELGDVLLQVVLHSQIAKEENEENMMWFLNNYPFKLESLDPYLPEELHSETTALGYLQLLPGVHKTDGFFIAKFRRK